MLSGTENPVAAEQDRKVTEAAARGWRVKVHHVQPRGPEEFHDVFAEIARDRADAVIVGLGTGFFVHRQRMVEAAARHRLPAIYFRRQFVESGRLMAYAASLRDEYAVAARLVDKILRGAKPADLPVEQSTKFEFVINLKTAKALGLTILPSLLLRADQVIE